MPLNDPPTPSVSGHPKGDSGGRKSAGKNSRQSKDNLKKGAPSAKPSDSSPDHTKKSKKAAKRSESSLSVVSGRSTASSHDVKKSSRGSVRINENSRKSASSAKSLRLRKKWRLITKRAASYVGSIASTDSRGKAKSYPIWPEFNDADIISEKWESATKGKDKGKSPSVACFEDPEGKIELPSSFKVHEWKRPVDFLKAETPVIVDDNAGDFDLLRANEHLCHSQLMRCIIGQITSLWNVSLKKSKSQATSSTKNSATPEPGEDSSWRPWEHIYALTKQLKGPNIPQYNHYGKYVVRLFWMGCWRKITVDDYMPFDSEGRLLLPALTEEIKLWPLILSKALIKVASIDYNSNENGREFGDFFVIHCLTGWIPETIPLEYGHLQKVWNLLKDTLPEWQRPEEKRKEPVPEPEVPPIPPPSSKKDRIESSLGKESVAGSAHKGSKGKDGKKKEDKDKSKSSPHSARPVSARSVGDKNALEQEEKLEKVPETVVFATFSLPEESPARVSVLKDMADASENLRKVGISHLHPHPVLLTKTRDIPLKPPPPPPPETPKWQQFRPRKPKKPILSEPKADALPPKPDQWLEITSTFINHRLSPLPLDPNFIKSQVSPLTPKGSRPTTGTALKGIEEDNGIRAEPAKPDGIFKAQFVSRRPSSRDSAKGEKRRGSARGQSPSSLSPTNSIKDQDQDRASLKSQSGQNDASQNDSKGSVVNDVFEDTKAPTADTSSIESVNKTMWMDFEDFCRSFQTLVIFHKPNTYACHQTSTEIKYSIVSGAPTGGTSSKKGSANVNHSNSSNNLKGSAVPKEEERTPKYLFVDNTEQSELVISFSVLPKWNGIESEREKKISDKDSVTGASEIVSVKDSGNSPLPSGLLIAEPYSWKSLIVGQPVLRVRTTGIRAACLTLPAGRHVLRFFFDTPLGYSLGLCSTVNFVYGDEETVMKSLVEESCRFVHTAKSIMQSIGKCIESLGDIEAWKIERAALRKAHMPYRAKNTKELNDHYEIWLKAFYETMTQVMTEHKAPALAFALRSFNYDLSPQSTGLLRESKDAVEIHESWINRAPSHEELRAAIKIQRYWRGTMARRFQRVLRNKDSTEHTTSRDILKQAWQLIQPNMETTGLKLLRSMLKQDHALIEKYPFHKDEWNKISYADYAGNYDDQHPNTWFVMFRETFIVEEDTLCVPKLYCSLKTSSLRVINNDTGEEIMRVFQKVAPHVYRKNKKGYTFICEARSLNNPLPAGKWRLRLIGSFSPLPCPTSGQVNHHFKIKDNQGYYMPNEKNIILRYHVKARSDLIGTIQLHTSKPDVYIKLQVLDHEIEVASTQGKGHCVLPAFYFYTDERPEERAASRLSQQDSRIILNQQSKQSIIGKKRTSSAKSKDGKKPKDVAEPRGSINKLESQSITSEDVGTEPIIPHSYTIQAIVERNSWPLTEKQWSFVQKLREQEKEDIKVYSAKQDRPMSPSPAAGGKTSAVQDKGKKKDKGEKGSKEKKMQDKESGSRPSSLVFSDSSKASWILNVVVDDEKSDDIDIKKDTDRQEQIKAEKRAWEAVQPGRAVMALQARLAYLEKHSKKVEKDSDKENEEEPVKSEDLSDAGGIDTRDEALLLQPPRPVTPKVILDPLDLTPFYSSESGEEVRTQYLDEDVLARKEKSEMELIQQYERERQSVLDWRENERNERLQLKISQIRTFQEMQNKLDDDRAELRKPREAYRQELLEEERRRKEEEEMKNAEMAASEATPVSPSPKGKKSAGKKKK